MLLSSEAEEESVDALYAKLNTAADGEPGNIVLVASLVLIARVVSNETCPDCQMDGLASLAASAADLVAQLGLPGHEFTNKVEICLAMMKMNRHSALN